MPLDPTPLLLRAAVIPVLTIRESGHAVALARALLAGGLPVMEVTMRTEVALRAVAAIIAEVPQAVVGVGTVTNAAEIELAVGAGARFVASPGTPPALADAFADAPVPALPGCDSVSAAMVLADRGFKVLKFFPAAASGGAAWLKAVAEPLPAIKFCPTGGVNVANAADYLALGNVIAVGGSWVAPQDLILARKFDRIAGLAHQAALLRR